MFARCQIRKSPRWFKKIIRGRPVDIGWKRSQDVLETNIFWLSKNLRWKHLRLRQLTFMSFLNITISQLDVFFQRSNITDKIYFNIVVKLLVAISLLLIMDICTVIIENILIRSTHFIYILLDTKLNFLTNFESCACPLSIYRSATKKVTLWQFLPVNAVRIFGTAILQIAFEWVSL